MKVLFLSHEATLSGAPLALLQIMRTLKSTIEGLEMEILLSHNGPLFEKFAELCPTKVIEEKEPLAHRVLCRFGIVGEWVPEYLMNIGKVHFDLIYVNSIVTLQKAIDIKRKYGIPVLAHFHEAELAVHFYRITEAMIDECDRFIVVSDLCKRNLVENFNVPEDRITLQYPSSPRMETLSTGNENIEPVVVEGIDDKDFVIGLSGTTYWIKSDDLVPVIIKRFFTKYPFADCKFLLIGLTPSVIERYEIDLDKAGLSDKIIMKERVSEPLAYYSRFDVVLIPSREESFGFVAQECAALKKPVVMFENVTGIAERMDSSSCILIPYLDTEAIVDTLFRLYEDRQLCSRLGKNACLKVSQMYAEDNHADNIVTLFRNLQNKENAIA